MSDTERPRIVVGHTNGDHVDWLVTPVEVSAGGFRASVGANLRAEELRDFRRALERVYADMRGRVELQSMEGWLALTVGVESFGRLGVHGVIIDRLGGGNKLTFSIGDMDLTYLPAIIRTLEEAEFFAPVMGDSEE